MRTLRCMTPGDAVRCPDCGTDILCEPGMPGLCPQCLLSLALRESPRAGSDDSSDPGEAHTIDRPAPGRILGERYQIRELLGRGGMGEVFRAFDLKLRVDVALKAVRAEKVESERARELLRREVRSAREVVSPNVCRIFDLVAEAAFSADARVALTWERRLDKLYDCRQALLHDLANRTSRPVTELGPCRGWRAALHLDPSGTVAVAAGDDGIVRVAKLAGGEPHLLVGHKGMVDRVAISPDLRWVATSGEDNTLRLWPMPDLAKPPLHALPRAELLAKLRSLTNIRVELDSSAPEGWRLEVGPFPGWKTVSEW